MLQNILNQRSSSGGRRAGAPSKRASMILYSDGMSHYSHRVRIVMAEKCIAVEIDDVDPAHKPEDLASLNPYNTLPVLVDRELVIHHHNIMMEYLDERFPHPPLFPVYPVDKAQSRQHIFRIDYEWCTTMVDPLMAAVGSRSSSNKALTQMRKELRESITATASFFREKPYFMSDEFTVVDCCIAPILWRLPLMGVDLGRSRSVMPLIEYRNRLFKRDSFRASLSEREKEMLS